MDDNTRRALLFSGALTAIIVGIFALAYVTATSANTFSFVGREYVAANDAAAGTVTVTRKSR